jgi:hypothetical protein
VNAYRCELLVYGSVAGAVGSIVAAVLASSGLPRFILLLKSTIVLLVVV